VGLLQAYHNYALELSDMIDWWTDTFPQNICPRCRETPFCFNLWPRRHFRIEYDKK